MRRSRKGARTAKLAVDTDEGVFPDAGWVYSDYALFAMCWTIVSAVHARAPSQQINALKSLARVLS